MARSVLRRMRDAVLGRPIQIGPPDPEAVARAEALGLGYLHHRRGVRFRTLAGSVDVMPAADVDLAALREARVPNGGHPGELLSRRDMRDQLRNLRGQHAGRSELEVLHALTISYLRRDTPQGAKALRLFRRIWAEEAEFLCEALPARWLIAALQTFYDRGTGGERTAGGIGFAYGNLVKVYETERDGASRVAGRDYPLANEAVPGLGGFTAGGDILLNLNVLVYDAALEGGLARAPLLALLSRVKAGDAIFRRIDALIGSVPEARRERFVRAWEGKEGE